MLHNLQLCWISDSVQQFVLKVAESPQKLVHCPVERQIEWFTPRPPRQVWAQSDQVWGIMSCHSVDQRLEQISFYQMNIRVKILWAKHKIETLITRNVINTTHASELLICWDIRQARTSGESEMSFISRVSQWWRHSHRWEIQVSFPAIQLATHHKTKDHALKAISSRV